MSIFTWVWRALQVSDFGAYTSFLEDARFFSFLYTRSCTLSLFFIAASFSSQDLSVFLRLVVWSDRQVEMPNDEKASAAAAQTRERTQNVPNVNKAAECV